MNEIPVKSSLIARHQFINKLSFNVFIGLIIITISLIIGMFGDHHFEKMTWIDAYVNAAMILSGMGPVSPLETEAGKLFAGSYALFSGIIFLVVMALVFAPVIHRFLHRFHLDESKSS